MIERMFGRLVWVFGLEILPVCSDTDWFFCVVCCKRVFASRVVLPFRFQKASEETQEKRQDVGSLA